MIKLTTAGRTIRLLIIQGNPLVRLGLRSVLERDTEMRVVGCSTEREQILQLVATQRPDVVLLDGTLAFHDGFSSISALRLVTHIRQAGRCGIIVLVPKVDETRLFQFLLAGAAAYELDNLGCADLLEKIRRVALGEYLISSAVLHAGGDTFLPNRERPLPRGEQTIGGRRESLPQAERPVITDLHAHEIQDAGLTEREIEVLLCVRYGLSNQQIAERLGIRSDTVKNHMTQILHRLHVYNRTAAVVSALRHRIIDFSDPLPTQKEREALSV